MAQRTGTQRNGLIDGRTDSVRRRMWCAALVLAALICPGGTVLAQGAGTVTVRQLPGDDVRWILPGPRRLDPALFGSPETPRRTEPVTGVPLADRLRSADGSRFTTTFGPTPFSDFFAPVTGGIEAVLIDRTPADTPQSQDRALLRAMFTGPGGRHQYRVELVQLLPVGTAHPTFGGVLLDGLIHGRTGVGTALQPTMRSHAALWGVARFFVDDRLIADDRLVQLMVTERVRSPDHDGYRLLWENERGTGGNLQAHLLLPDVAVTADGLAQRPLETGLITPTGMRQPFVYLIFESAAIGGGPSAALR